MPICQDIIKKNGTQCLHVSIQSAVVSNSGKMSVNLSGADHSQMPKCQQKNLPPPKKKSFRHCIRNFEQMNEKCVYMSQ